MAQKILVVEDETSIREILGRFLGEMGYEVRQAAHGAEALEILDRESFSLVIADLVMPHVNGIRLIESIQTKWPRTSTMLLTAYLSAGAGNMIMQGRTEVVPKPLELSQLLATVRRILASKSMLLFSYAPCMTSSLI
jgi:DNA-binding NtrC family response regulator